MKGFIALFALAISLTFSSVHAEEPNGPVNINTASAEELSELKGVGKTKAEAIVAHRNEHGEFSKVEDLTQVKGIGESILKSNRPLLSLE
ncbi:MAG: helix-hairpin-helix domain-containing protein [Thalassolituus maritimus]|jgi:competence protein ComEA|uniref:Competence protein ComEA n=1 Tax=Thalassolituus maritimus TaxID=484498 RepID=A0A1N7J953_9GAMM|nr:helix-hairpin-helix domain-containing protein [Thalassolituus maritimus]TPD56002.1 MAG: helix-hairpin-helix domain-containing protein [Thalassolituus maritimus]SIS45878.1 competence protein ComEA [Thalassolituus maritimus]